MRSTVVGGKTACGIGDKRAACLSELSQLHAGYLSSRSHGCKPRMEHTSQVKEVMDITYRSFEVHVDLQMDFATPPYSDEARIAGLLPRTLKFCIQGSRADIIVEVAVTLPNLHSLSKAIFVVPYISSFFSSVTARPLDSLAEEKPWLPPRPPSPSMAPAPTLQTS